MKHFLDDIGSRIITEETAQRKEDRKQATRFNVFDLIRPDENTLSDILADLLDPNGKHGQGDVFLRLLLHKIGVGSDPRLAEHATVHREAPTHGIEKYRRRIDVLVDAGALVAIENKVDSVEQLLQVSDYLEHLRRCTHGTKRKAVLIYLTPDCRRPGSLTDDRFQELRAAGLLFCWSYQMEIREWLESCREKCQATKIQHFFSDFISYIKSDLKRELASPLEPSNEN